MPKLITIVMGEFHKRVPFPWTVEKITAAGYEPIALIGELCDQLTDCTDSADADVVDILRTFKELKETL